MIVEISDTSLYIYLYNKDIPSMDILIKIHELYAEYYKG
jgi:hypothetical protein